MSWEIKETCLIALFVSLCLAWTRRLGRLRGLASFGLTLPLFKKAYCRDRYLSIVGFGFHTLSLLRYDSYLFAIWVFLWPWIFFLFDVKHQQKSLKFLKISQINLNETHLKRTQALFSWFKISALLFLLLNLSLSNIETPTN